MEVVEGELIMIREGNAQWKLRAWPAPGSEDTGSVVPHPPRAKGRVRRKARRVGIARSASSKPRSCFSFSR